MQHYHGDGDCLVPAAGHDRSDRTREDRVFDPEAERMADGDYEVDVTVDGKPGPSKSFKVH